MELIKENDILILKMDAPGNNIMTGDFMDSLLSCLREAETYADDKSVKGFIITGSGRHFSCGADIPSLMERSASELEEYNSTGKLPKVHTEQKHALTMLSELPFPVISVVKGFCIGSGSEIAVNSHIRICEPTARVGQPESTFGILPALGGIAKTTEICGLSDAIEMVLTGNLLSAAEAEGRQWCDILCERNQGYSTAVRLIEFINENFSGYDRDRSAEYVSEFVKIQKTGIHNIRKIGIAGYGKMGQDIFNVLHDNIFDAEFVVLCRHDEDTHTEKVQKNLSKSLKRGKLTEIAYKISSSNFIFTTDISHLNDCDLIIETISEDISAKRELFAEFDKTVKEDCIFASNTSSLQLSEIFSDVRKHKFMGVHFFYPVKLSGTIEFNNCCDCKMAEAFCNALKKEAVFFENEYCFYLNQFISFAVSAAVSIKENYSISTSKMMEVLYDVFPQHALFGMVDSIGLKLFTSGENDTLVKRIQNLVVSVKNYFSGILNDGCPGEPGNFLRYISEKENESSGSEISSDEIKEMIISAILNEAVNASEECGSDMTSILGDALSISETMNSYYEDLGYEKIRNAVDKMNSIIPSEAFITASEEIFKKYFD
ncbi:MAG: 3-hydroxyacyl-CoA dehydrogenase NAD-binding domain-containing protein [Oscillospiraceae bacterium]|nr:3-hydroxyacyl-CoA dehydrogenase NAD-binding domain-containing protein [Oscillospiraceae bacterium]